MYIINRRKNIRLIGDEHHIGDCFRYCTNPYIN